jgi:hypothetical protein
MISDQIPGAFKKWKGDKVTKWKVSGTKKPQAKKKK